MSHQYRIKEAATTRVRARFTDDVDPKNAAACNTMLAGQVKARRIRIAVQLQHLHPRRGWVDVGSPTSGH